MKKLILLLLIFIPCYGDNDSVYTFPNKLKDELFQLCYTWALSKGFSESTVVQYDPWGNVTHYSNIIEKKETELIVLKGTEKITARWLKYIMTINIKNEKIRIQYTTISKAPQNKIEKYLNEHTQNLIKYIQNSNW